MTVMWGTRVGQSIVPYSRFQRALAEFPEGTRLRIKVDNDRNGKFAALYHVMLGLVVKAINSGPASTDIDTLKRWVKLRRGMYDTVPLPKPAPDGTTHAITYRSTSFAKMGEQEFHEFAMATCELIRAELAPWISQSPEWSEIARIVASILPEDGA